jgi:ribosome maturation protein Sdo1
MHRKNRIKLPPAMQVAVLTELASKFIKDEDTVEYIKWMDVAILNAAGQKEIQEQLVQAKTDSVEMRGIQVFNKPSSKPA